MSYVNLRPHTTLNPTHNHVVVDYGLWMVNPDRAIRLGKVFDKYAEALAYMSEMNEPGAD